MIFALTVNHLIVKCLLIQEKINLNQLKLYILVGAEYFIFVHFF